MSATYIIASPSDIGRHLRPWYVDMIAEPPVLVLTDRTRIPMGVPLCSGCDAVMQAENVCPNCGE